MAAIVFILCALTSGACAFLLMRQFARSRHRFLLWSGICFVFFAINNLLLVLDRVVLLDIDLSLWRSFAMLCGACILIFGIIWDANN